jgi:hypothetical protein
MILINSRGKACDAERLRYIQSLQHTIRLIESKYPNCEDRINQLRIEVDAIPNTY